MTVSSKCTMKMLNVTIQQANRRIEKKYIWKIKLTISMRVLSNESYMYKSTVANIEICFKCGVQSILKSIYCNLNKRFWCHDFNFLLKSNNSSREMEPLNHFIEYVEYYTVVSDEETQKRYNKNINWLSLKQCF